MSNLKWWKIEDELLECYSRIDSYRMNKKEFPNELNVRNSKFTYNAEITFGIAAITLPWLLLLKHFELGTFIGIGIMIVMGLVIIQGAKEKNSINKYDIKKDGIQYKGQHIKWENVIEIQRIRLSKKRRQEVLRIMTNETPLELPLNSDLNPKPNVIMDYINYMINNYENLP